jgi:hypothetical protein
MGFNRKEEVACPNCSVIRLVRNDYIKKYNELNKPMYCLKCSRSLFPRETGGKTKKGSGIKNTPELSYTYSSYLKARQRSKMGAKHHPCYEGVEFKFKNLQHLIDCIGLRPKGMTLDRINTLGNYEPGNVRWATKSEQARNRVKKGYWQNHGNIPNCNGRFSDTAQ